MAENGQVLLSRPTFAELADALGKSGRPELFNEDGDIVIGSIAFHTERDVPQAARLAAAFADAAPRRRPEDGDPVYEDDEVSLFARRKHEDVQLIEQRPGLDPRILTLPNAALTPLSIELIECLGRSPAD